MEAKKEDAENKLSMHTPDEFEAKVKILSLCELEPADHIVVSTDAKKYCHAIVDSVDAEQNHLDVIYFDDTETQCSLDAYMRSATCSLLKPSDVVLDTTIQPDGKKPAETVDCRKHGVKKSSLLIDLAEVEVFKIGYEEPVMTAEQTLAKARKYIGHVKYNVFINNDEHFAIYCKTGKAAKLFIIDPKEVSATRVLGKSKDIL